MKRRALACVCGLLLLIGNLSAQSEDSKPFGGTSIGIDLVSLTYGQLLVYFEQPISSSVSIDVAIGYSPGGAWNSDFSYWYLQSDLRTYVEGKGPIGLYTEFGVAGYLADRKLSFSRWRLNPGYDTSVVLGATGGIGYKYFVPSANGWYVDTNAFVYGLVPEPILATKSIDSAEFQYSPFNLLGSVIVGYGF